MKKQDSETRLIYRQRDATSFFVTIQTSPIHEIQSYELVVVRIGTLLTVAEEELNVLFSQLVSNPVHSSGG